MHSSDDGMEEALPTNIARVGVCLRKIVFRSSAHFVSIRTLLLIHAFVSGKLTKSGRFNPHTCRRKKAFFAFSFCNMATSRGHQQQTNAEQTHCCTKKRTQKILSTFSTVVDNPVSALPLCYLPLYMVAISRPGITIDTLTPIKPNQIE